jgi:hypothetical protein
MGVLEWVALILAFIVTVAMLAWRDRAFWRNHWPRKDDE